MWTQSRLDSASWRNKCLWAVGFVCCLTEPLRAQVLATGLSGLYSSLPTKLDVPGEDWHCLHREDWLQMPSLVQFLNSLEFCNAVIQVGGGRGGTLGWVAGPPPV